jgi:transposase-like protein
MEFPITDLLDYTSSVTWVTQYFHPTGFNCPECGAPWMQARVFRKTRRSELVVYRCRQCDMVYNLYTGTVFQQTHLTPKQVVLLMRGICKGESSKVLAAELKLNYVTVLTLRHLIQVNAEQSQPETPLPDQRTETDEMFQNAGEKR